MTVILGFRSVFHDEREKERETERERERERERGNVDFNATGVLQRENPRARKLTRKNTSVRMKEAWRRGGISFFGQGGKTREKEE